MTHHVCSTHPATAVVRCAGIAAVALGCALAPSLARADGTTDAKTLFEQGRALRARSDCAGAIPLFRRAYESYRAGLGSLRNLAECQETLGQFASARRSWLELGQTLVVHHEPRYDGWADDARQSAARLAPKVATLTVDVHAETRSGETVSTDGTHGLDRLDVTLNGEHLASAVLGAPLERDPGDYVVRASGGRAVAPSEQRIELSSGQAQRVVLRVVVANEPGESRADDSHPHVDATRRTLGWVVAGTGTAALVGAGISWLVRQSAMDQLVNAGCSEGNGLEHCAAGQSASARADLQAADDRGHTAGALATVFLVTGVVGLGAGIALIATSASHPATPTVGVFLSPTGLSATGSF